MVTTVVVKTFNVSADIYEKFSSYCKELGLSMSRQIDMFMRAQVEDKPKVRKEYLQKLEKIRKGKFVKVNEKPLDYDDAVARGSYVADNTAAVTFKVVKSKKGAEKSNNPSSSFARSKFRGRKIKGKEVRQPNTFLEKNKHRIDSTGEYKGITVKGLISKEKQRAANRIASKKAAASLTGGKTLKLQPAPKPKRNVGQAKLKSQRFKL